MPVPFAVVADAEPVPKIFVPVCRAGRPRLRAGQLNLSWFESTSALEFFFRARLEGLSVTREAMLSAYHDAWRRQRQDTPDIPVRFNKGDDEQTLDALADRMIGAFLDSPLANPKGVIVAVEEELRIVLRTICPTCWPKLIS